MRCDYFERGKCASCNWITRHYAEQLAAKNLHLHSRLDTYRPGEWLEPAASPEQGFRNKAKMAVLGTADAPLLGIVNSLGEAISLCDCPLYPDDMQALLRRIQAWVRQAGLPPYRIDKRVGELKFVLLTRSRFSGEYLLRFVLRSEQMLSRIQDHVPLLLDECPNIRVVSANIQPVHMAVIEGEKEIFLGDNTHLAEKLNDVQLFIRPKSFFQTNIAVAEKLYATAREWAAEIKPSSVWDLFCGVGGFGLHCATQDTQLTGIEIEPEAIACAQLSAQALGLKHVSFAAFDAVLFAAREDAAPDLLIVNPPRRGLGETLCRQIAAVAPQHIFYSSCNPETLARDLAQLAGYRVERVQLFDMFPHTAHYEVLTQLARA
jgi:23S rRNA (uracil747-C5)-methyltransferase